MPTKACPSVPTKGARNQPGNLTLASDQVTPLLIMPAGIEHRWTVYFPSNISINCTWYHMIAFHWRCVLPLRHTIYKCVYIYMSCIVYMCFSWPSNSKVPIIQRVFDDRLLLQLIQHHSSGIFCSPSVDRWCWYAPKWNLYLWRCQWREWYEKLHRSGRCTLHFANPMLQPPSKLEAICLVQREAKFQAWCVKCCWPIMIRTLQ